MSLIDEIKKLLELEQQADCGPWYAGVHPDDCDMCEDCDPDEEGLCDNPIRPGAVQVIDPDVTYSVYLEFEDSDIDDPRFIVVSRNLAPAMLSVLACFHDGDAETLGEILDVFQFDGEPMSVVYADCISRLQKAASLMEQDS